MDPLKAWQEPRFFVVVVFFFFLNSNNKSAVSAVSFKVIQTVQNLTSISKK